MFVLPPSFSGSADVVLCNVIYIEGAVDLEANPILVEDLGSEDASFRLDPAVTEHLVDS